MAAAHVLTRFPTKTLQSLQASKPGLSNLWPVGRIRPAGPKKMVALTDEVIG